MYFDGVDDYATIPSFDIRTTDFTIALWIKTDGMWNISAADVLSDKKDSVKQFSLFLHSGAFKFNTFGASETNIFKIALQGRYITITLLIVCLYL